MATEQRKAAQRIVSGDGERTAAYRRVQPYHSTEADAMQQLHAVYALILSWSVKLKGAKADLVGAADYESS